MSDRSTRFLVVGASGLVGSALVKTLAGMGYPVKKLSQKSLSSMSARAFRDYWAALARDEGMLQVIWAG